MSLRLKRVNWTKIIVRCCKLDSFFNFLFLNQWYFVSLLVDWIIFLKGHVGKYADCMVVHLDQVSSWWLFRAKFQRSGNPFLKYFDNVPLVDFVLKMKFNCSALFLNLALFPLKFLIYINHAGLSLSNLHHVLRKAIVNLSPRTSRMEFYLIS